MIEPLGQVDSKTLPDPFELDFKGRTISTEPEWHVAVKLVGLDVRVNINAPTKLVRDVVRTLASNPQEIWPEIFGAFAREAIHADDLEKLYGMNYALVEEVQIFSACHSWLSGLGSREIG